MTLLKNQKREENNNMKKILLFTFLFTAIFLFVKPNQTFASVGDNVFGSVWSENVGWISFNSCTNPNDVNTCSGNYGVNLDLSSKNVQGHAWNKNIGWISFDPTDWGTCPPNAGGCNLSTFQNKWQSGGWARATSSLINPNNSGWDGWISLGGASYDAIIDTMTNIGPSMNSPFNTVKVYSITSSSNGYWWGDEVIGWIDLNRASFNPTEGGVFVLESGVKLILTPESSIVTAGDNITFDWETIGITPISCTGKGHINNTIQDPFSDWKKTFAVVGTQGTIGGPQKITIPYDTNNVDSQTTLFTLECTDGFSTVQQVAQVVTVPLSASISQNSSCAYNTLHLDFVSNDSSPSCNVTANPQGLSSYSVNFNPLSSDIVDSNFKNVDTEYTMQCTNGNNSFLSPVSVQVIENGIACNESYELQALNSNYCDGRYSNTMVYDPVSAVYESEIELTLGVTFGYEEDTEFTYQSPKFGTMTVTPVPNIFTYDGVVFSNLIAKISMSEVQYNLYDWSNSLSVSATTTEVGTTENKNYNLRFCGTGQAPIKPKYKPF